MTATTTCSNCRFPVRRWTCEQGYCDHRQHCDCEKSGGREIRIVGEVEGLEVTGHAALRWYQRTESMRPPCNLEHAWTQAVPVGSPEFDSGTTGRSYEPENVIILAHTGRIRTVLKTEWVAELRTEHLKRCENCSNRWDPADGDECSWCDGDDAPRYVRPEGTTIQWERPEELHECPSCGELTFGYSEDWIDDDRCKVCFLSSDPERRSDTEDYCREDGCFELVEGGGYCELHRLIRQERAIAEEEAGSRGEAE